MKNFFGLICLSLLFVSCASLQDDVQSVSSTNRVNSKTNQFENAIIEYDAQSLINNSFLQQKSAELEKLCSTIKAEANENKTNRDALSHLYALEGRVELLLGKREEAEKSFKSSKGLNPNDVQVLILGSRLAKDVDAQKEQLLKAIDKNTDKELVIEQGVLFYKSNEFSKAVACFDSAFAELPINYKNAYLPIRQKAWLLKDSNLENLKTQTANTSKVTSLITAEELDLEGMLLITQSESSIFSRYTNNKENSAKALFNIAKKNKWFGKGSTPKLNELITRSLVARFLWSVYTQNQYGVANEVDYQSEYINVYENGSKRYAESPIEDVEIQSDDFNAIAGCVENEILELKKGVKFEPDGKVSGSEYLKSLKKASN